MFISEIKIDTYNIPLPEPVEAYAAGIMKSFDLVICRVTNDNGKLDILWVPGENQ